MNLKQATLVFTSNDTPFIVTNDPINLGDLTFSIEENMVGTYHNEAHDKTFLRKVIASPEQIGWMVVSGIMQPIERQFIRQMLPGQFSVELTMNGDVKLFQDKIIIHK